MTVPIPGQNGDRARVDTHRVRRETQSGTVWRAASGGLDRADPRPAGGPAPADLLPGRVYDDHTVRGR